MNIVAVCGSFHKSEIEQMLNYAKDEATKHSIEITKVIWVPGSMEVPLAIERSFSRHGSLIDGAICLGIIEKGETQHGAAMGNAVIKSIIDLNLLIQFSKSDPNFEKYIKDLEDYRSKWGA